MRMATRIGNAIAAAIAMMLLAGGASHVRADDLAIWREFMKELRGGGMADTSRVRTYDPAQRAPLMAALEGMRGLLLWDSCTTAPEVFRVGDQVHFVAPLVFQQGGATGHATFCFTFLTRGERWYFQHLESIVLRLDRLGPPPVSSFPDLPEERKAWMRDELQTSLDIAHYVTLAREKGAEAARSWFVDGAGYALAARTWVPFVPPQRAFVLYLCWEQANLRGQKVTLEALADSAARVRLAPRWFELYRRTTHLRTEISEADYRALFETIWRDRAANAGWNVAFAYEGDEVVFALTRAGSRAGTSSAP
ncbi:MAG TPA: hypothetical protein VMS88_01315 [Terriglobales bacterium]|nr:hypothetical protein [Terriglobales bacterium]